MRWSGGIKLAKNTGKMGRLGFVPIASNCRDELMEALRLLWTVK